MKILLATLMVMTSVLFGVKLSADINSVSKTDENNSEKTESSITYVLKYDDGNVSLFEDNTIVETFNEINIDMLPQADRQNLYDGIVLNSIDEVYELIEDFDG